MKKLLIILLFGIFLSILISFSTDSILISDFNNTLTSENLTMANISLYESHTDSPSLVNIYSTIARAQTFTVGNTGSNEDFRLTSIKLRISKIGNPPNPLNVTLRPVNSTGGPIGIREENGILSNGSIDASIVDSSIINEINMSAYTLEQDTKYAIVVSTSGGDNDNKYIIGLDIAAPIYTGGSSYYSPTSTWLDITSDLYFQVYGYPVTLDSYETYGGVGEEHKIFNYTWGAQTFTVGDNDDNITQRLSYLKLRLSRFSTPDDIDISIKATNPLALFEPTGADLSTGTISPADLTNSLANYNIMMTPYDLQPGTTYAIVVRASYITDSNDVINWSYDSSGTYSGGLRQYSTDNGSSWSQDSSSDYYFDVFGSPVLENLPYNVTRYINISRYSNVTSATINLTGLSLLNQGIEFPNNVSIFMNNTKIWSMSNEFNSTFSPNITNDLFSNFSDALNDGNCDCSGCSLIENNKTCSIPLIFHTDSPGWLEYENLDVNYDSIPYVYLKTPINDTWDDANVTFTCNATDEINLLNVTLYVWNSTSLYNSSMFTNINGTENSTSFNMNITRTDTYSWNCFVENNGSYSNWAEDNYTLNVNIDNPVITLETPLNDTWLNNGTNINFSYTPEHEGQTVEFCALYGNWSGGWHENLTAITTSTTISLQTKNSENLGDTYVHGNVRNVDKNYGTTIDIILSGLSAWSIRDYLRFNISDIPSGATITNATLYFYVYSNTSGIDTSYGIYEVYSNKSWVEGSLDNVNATGQSMETNITWNNQPCGTAFNNATACNLTVIDYMNWTASSKSDEWINWNVTDIVERNLNVNNNVSFAIKHFNESSGSNYLSIISSDNGTDTELYPMLNITYTPSEIVESTMNTFFQNISDGNYIWDIWCNTTETSASSFNNLGNYTFHIDTINPSITIDVVENASSQTFTFNGTSSDVNNYTCKYSIFNSTSGIDGTNENISYTCNAETSATASDFGNYNLTTYATDLADNEESNTSKFTLTAPATTTIISGGGGNAPGGVGEGNWTMETETGVFKYQFNMIPGSTRTRRILLENLEEQEMTITFSCDTTNSTKNLCEHLTLPSEPLILPVQKDIKESISFTLSLPDNLEEDDYITNIIGTDGLKRRNALTVEVNVGKFGFVSETFDKFFLSKSLFGLPIPYSIIFLFSLAFFVVGLYFVGFRKFNLGLFISMLIGSGGSIILLLVL